MYEIMKSPFSVGSLTLKNHVVMPAIGVNLSALGGGVSDDIIAFYEARAKGGVGLIISEITRVTDGAGAGEPYQLSARGVYDVPDLQRLVDAVHKYNTKFFIQLHHPGFMGSMYVTGEKLVAPSVLPGLEETVRELTTLECDSLVQAFVTGAVASQMAYADGVELHGAHGYLINEFLSPATNHRCDKYGGDFEGRMLFVTEIIKGIKKSCGPDFPVSVRINAVEEMPGFTGGIDLEESKRIAVTLEKAGADAINVSCLSEGCIETKEYVQGWRKYMPAAIKSVVDVPVIAVCNIIEPKIGEDLLIEGICDLVAVGRGHLADPQWCEKAFAGRENEICLCIRCNICFGEINKLNRIKCAVNPKLGFEKD